MRHFSVREVAPWFREYRERPHNGSWGSLHIVLDDGNLGDKSVQCCIQWARERGDLDGIFLGNVLACMSRSQRGRLSWAAYE